MEFKNYLEEVVQEVLNDVLEKYLARQEDLCACQKCRNDIAALALNYLPPKYTVTDLGRIYTKLEITRAQFRVDVVKELARAIEKVRLAPRHTAPNLQEKV